MKLLKSQSSLVLSKLCVYLNCLTILLMKFQTISQVICTRLLHSVLTVTSSATSLTLCTSLKISSFYDSLPTNSQRCPMCSLICPHLMSSILTIIKLLQLKKTLKICVLSFLSISLATPSSNNKTNSPKNAKNHS